MPRSLSSVYQIPSKNYTRRSDYFHQIAQDYDKRFNMEVIIVVTFQFIINLLITGLWVGIVMGIWLNWGDGYRKFTALKDYDCTLEKYFGKLSKLIEIDSVKDAHWTSQTTNQTNNELQVTTSGLYAVTSVINFRCDRNVVNHGFVHFVNTSNGKSVQDRADLDQSVYKNGTLCYRSFIYATFQMNRGDHFRVQVLTKTYVDKKGSHLMYYRIRDPLRCSRRFIGPIINKNLNTVAENGSMKVEDQFLGQKVFSGGHYWWNDWYLKRWSCDGSCDKKL